MENLDKLVRTLCSYPSESAWLEFKHDNYDSDMIGADICALANGAALEEKDRAYFLWGISDDTHALVGTTYDLLTLKKGNEELENWLRRSLSKNADFVYQTVQMDMVSVGVMIIQCAVDRPVTFKKKTYLRVGSYTKDAAEYPMLQAKLWARLQARRSESMLARKDMSLDQALRLLDHGIYFDLLGLPQPSSLEGVAHYLQEDGVLVHQDDGRYAVTNMGALLFARRLPELPQVSRKAVRVVQYAGRNRLDMLKDETIAQGYAAGFESLMRFLEALIPTQEPIPGALREKRAAYPLLAVREAVANALIHQDLSISGAGPTIELFSDRIEITNPGLPLVDVRRIIDDPPRSRNERLAAMMRRLRMCEELGTGWDKIVLTCEQAQLPAPRIELYEESTKVTLFAMVPFSSLSREARLHACYFHACILHVQGDQLTNRSLRERFGLERSSAGSISRLIKEAVTEGAIKPLDPTTSNKYMCYVPFWA